MKKTTTHINIEVLCERLDGIVNLITEKFDVNECSHQKIIEQTTKTNGRVTTLEAWRNKIIGALIISNIIILPTLFLLVKYILEK